MSNVDTAPATPPVSPASPGGYAWAGLRVALLGSFMVGLIECTAACTVALKHYGDSNWPWSLLIATVGKAFTTHALVWCPLFVLVGLLLGWILRRLPRHAPEAPMVLLFVLLAGTVIAPSDLLLAERYTRTRMLVLCAAALALGLGLYVLLRWWTLRRGRALISRLLNTVTMVALLAGGAAFVVFFQSALFNPGNYRAPQGSLAKSKPPHPHVLWIMLDTVRADHTSMYGYQLPTTPRLAEFARDAITFDHGVASGIWTLPNHASMFSGLPRRAHGADFRHPRLDKSFPTVAEILRDHGYATALFSNNPWVSPDTEIARGFDVQRIIYHLRHINRSSIGWNLERRGLPPPLPWLDEDFGGAMTNALIADWLDDRDDADQPVFVFVNYMDAHLPYRVPARYREMFLTPQQVRRSFEMPLKVYRGIVDALDRRFNFGDQSFVPASDREILKGQYDAGIRYLDDRVNEVLDMFRQRGMLENTLVVIVSDHGEYLDQHGQWAHRMQVYQDLLNIVMVLRPPGLPAGQRVSTPVQLSDLYTTVLGVTVGTNGAVAGEPAGAAVWPARDLLELAAGDADEGRIAVSEYTGDSPENMERIRRSNDPQLQRRALSQVTAQDARYKLIISADGTQELFDLSTDLREEKNLVKELPIEAQRLGRYLNNWHLRVPQHQAAEGEPIPVLDPELIRALKSLGYLGDD